MPCTNCEDCLDPKPDSCIIYTGEAFEALGICPGKTTLLEVEAILLQKITDIATGHGITLNPTVSCSYLTSLINKDLSLPSLVQAFSTAICTLSTQVGVLNTQMGASTAFQTGCLVLPNSMPTRDQVLQAVVSKVCSLDSRVTAIEGDYVKASGLNSLIALYLSGQSTPDYYSRMVPYAAVPYFGPLSNFDASGIGNPAFGFKKVYLCNGQTVGSFKTPDMRGRTAVGAITGVPGGALDAEVDPTLPVNTGMSWALKQKFGINSVALSTLEMPAHTHVVTDPGHDHDNGWAGDAKGGPDGNHHVDTATAFPKKTGKSTTGITVGSAGSSQPHTNLQPSIATYFIMYIPS